MVNSVQREDKGTYICRIEQSRGSESTSEKSQRINVMVVGKMCKKYIVILRRVQSLIQGKSIVGL